MSDTQVAVQTQGNPLMLPSQQEWAQIKDMCSIAIKSGMLPASIKTPEAAAVIAIKARELGVPMMVGFSNIHVINGKPCMSAELIQAQARKNLPGLVFNVLETDSEKCVVEAIRPEKGSKPVKVTFSMADARAAELVSKTVWKQYPAAMLRSRAITACLRLVCPDALMGVSYTPEELGAKDDSGIIETTHRRVEPKPEMKSEPVKAESEMKADPIVDFSLSQIAETAKNEGWTSEDLKELMFSMFQISDSKKLTREQRVELMSHVTSSAFEKDVEADRQHEEHRDRVHFGMGTIQDPVMMTLK